MPADSGWSNNPTADVTEHLRSSPEFYVEASDLINSIAAGGSLTEDVEQAASIVRSIVLGHRIDRGSSCALSALSLDDVAWSDLGEQLLLDLISEVR